MQVWPPEDLEESVRGGVFDDGDLCPWLLVKVSFQRGPGVAAMASKKLPGEHAMGGMLYSVCSWIDVVRWQGFPFWFALALPRSVGRSVGLAELSGQINHSIR